MDASERVENPSFSGYEENRLFTRVGGRFYDTALAAGVGTELDSRSVVAADLDGDGDQDLVVRNVRGTQVQIFENVLENDHGHLEVSLKQPAPNIRAIGARVSLTCGGKTQLRQQTAGDGFLSQAPYGLFFGLGACKGPIALKVSWPNGTVSHHEKVAPNQRITITRP